MRADLDRPLGRGYLIEKFCTPSRLSAHGGADGHDCSRSGARFPSDSARRFNPGDQYRLVFVTTGTRDASSTDISVYDAFVTTEANSNAALFALGTTWLAIGSTSAVSAFDHIGGNFNIPIYNLAGSKVATGASDLWDSSIGAPIEFDENGNLKSTPAWTGTNPNGTIVTGESLGSGTAWFGTSSHTDSSWVFGGKTGATTPFSFYGISGTLTVPASVPEPGSVGLVGLALATLAGLRRYGSRPK